MKERNLGNVPLTQKRYALQAIRICRVEHDEEVTWRDYPNEYLWYKDQSEFFGSVTTTRMKGTMFRRVFQRVKPFKGYP